MVQKRYKEAANLYQLTQEKFGVWTYQQVKENFHFFEENSLVQDAQPCSLSYGILDKKTRIGSKGAECKTCGRDFADCADHFSYIELELPVYHTRFFDTLVTILQSICKTCSRILLDNTAKEESQCHFNDGDANFFRKKALRKEILVKCKQVAFCPHCGSGNGEVKKCGMFKISHRRLRSTNKDDQLIPDKVTAYSDVTEYNKEVDSMASSGLVLLNPREVLRLLERIPDSDIQFLSMNPDHVHPKDLILSRVPIPPICFRRPTVSELQTTEDSLTKKLTEITFLNDVISKHRLSGTGVQAIVEDWDFLQLQCALYINSELSGIPLKLQMNKTILSTGGLVQRMTEQLISSVPNASTYQEVEVPAHLRILPFPPHIFDPIVLVKHFLEKGAYGGQYLCSKNCFFDRPSAMYLMMMVLGGDLDNTKIEFPAPCIQEPMTLWSGKQIFSLILRPNRNAPVKVNLTTVPKSSTSTEDLSLSHSYVTMRNSELLAGSLDSTTIGPKRGNDNIFYIILRKYGKEEAIRCMWRLCLVKSNF